MIPNFNSIYNFFKQRIFLDIHEKNYIHFNNKKWKKTSKITKEKKPSVILVDLFPWYPHIYIWSYISNILSTKINAEIKYYYFDFYQSNAGKFNLFIRKLVKIYESFNAKKGITEYDFKYSKKEILNFEKHFKRIKKKKDVINFKIEKLKIGSLIYDSYVRTTLEPTIKIDDRRFKVIFFRSLKIYFEIKKYFNKNNVKCVIPSHLCYMSYGIISKYAISKKIPVIKLRSDKGGQVSFRISKIDKYNLNEPPYYEYRKNFSHFSKDHQVKALKVGKEILKGRLSGNFDKYLPYMEKSQFRDKSKKISINKNNKKQKIIIFPHCFYDYPHRFRNMIFNDFYEHALYFMKQSEKYNEYDWYYKPHPTSLPGHVNIHKVLLKKFPNINYLNKDVSHKEIIRLNPKCIITNHGSVAHEYASFNIPCVNTGDNHHINYDFCLHAKSFSHLNEIMSNLDKYIKKINFDKKQIYEFLYMHNYYYPNLNNENKLIKDEYFITKNTKLNHSSKILSYIIKKDKTSYKNIIKYISDILDQNF